MECNKHVTLLTFLESGDLIGELNKVVDIPYIKSHGDVITLYLNRYFGERIVFSGVRNLSMEQVALLIAQEFSDKWMGIIEGLESFDNLAADYIRTVTVDEDINRDKTFENVNKVAAFNSDALVNDNGNDANEDEVTKRGMKEREVYLTLKSMFDNLPMLEKYNILNSVASDIANSLTISIY